MSNIFQSLWIGGTLSKMEQLAMKSFVDNFDLREILGTKLTPDGAASKLIKKN